MKLTNTNTKRLGWVISLLGGSILLSTILMPRTDFMPRAPIDGFFFNLSMPPCGNLEFLEKEVASRVKKRLAPYLSGEKQPKINT